MDDKQEERPYIFVDDNALADLIQTMLAAADIEVEKQVIRLIMQYQTNNYENLGILKIKYE